MSTALTHEIAATAARIVVEEGAEYGPAKRRAAKLVARGAVRSADWPDNDLLEDEVRLYLELFCGDTQPAELASLRRLAQQWMQRLQTLRPHLCGAVWRGTATARSAVYLELYADDAKAAEIELINLGVQFQVASSTGPKGQPVDQLVIDAPCAELASTVPLVLTVLDHDDLRGRLKPDARGRSERGDLTALRRLLASEQPVVTDLPASGKVESRHASQDNEP
jgi:hypothetical protein